MSTGSEYKEGWLKRKRLLEQELADLWMREAKLAEELEGVKRPKLEADCGRAMALRALLPETLVQVGLMKEIVASLSLVDIRRIICSYAEEKLKFELSED